MFQFIPPENVKVIPIETLHVSIPDEERKST